MVANALRTPFDPTRKSARLSSIEPIVWLLMLTAAIAAPALGQGVQPIGRIDPRAQPLAQVATLDVAPLDRVAIDAEDVQRRINGEPARYAIPHPVQATSAANGTWQALDAVWSLWRLRVRAPNASHVNLGFTTCRLPPTARLMVYAADYSDLVRPFDAADVSPSGQLWTPVVRGAAIVVEVSLHTAQRPQLEVTIGQVGSGYRFFGAGPTAVPAPGRPALGPCNIDVACSQGAAWLTEISGVGAFSTGGSIFCTGSMLNNTAQDGRNYFLTAYHCGIRSTNAASLVVYWNYQNTTCGGPDVGRGLQFSTGSALRAEYAATDFTLVELNTAPDSAWGVTYLGWERLCDCATSAVTIHHPSGDPKKISLENDPTEITSYSGTTTPGDGTHIRVVDWDAGSTEPGSSGAPLFSQNKRVIGQLHGGAAACGNNNSDWYGRFSMSWTGGGTPSTRLSDWLDPGNTGATAVNTFGRASYRTFAPGCSGSMATTRLTAQGPPNVGSTLRVDLDNLPANAAFMMIGFSITTSPFGPLPMGLAWLGMPGCVLHVSPDVLASVSGSGNRATFAMTVPPASHLMGVRFFQQALVLDPAAGNAAGLVISDAAVAVINGAPGGIAGGRTPNMVTISPGTFLMGSNAATGTPYYSQAWERPVHQVTISRPFCMSKYEVTQAEYQAVMGINPSYFQGTSWPNSANRPVEQVTWLDAMAYCAALTAREAAAGRLPAGYQYRLPTEAEWEYCCRAGTTTEYHYGNTLVCGQASFAYSHHTNSSCNSNSTVVVGGYAPNAWGLHDMHGNVWEWCLDWWDLSSNYPSSPVVDPYVNSGPFRVIRGGSWGDYSDFCRSAFRYRYFPALRGIALGFRVVLAPVLV